MADVTNPGLVNVANQGYDFLAVPDQVITVTSPGPPLVNVNGANFQPGGVPRDVGVNNVVGQVYGTGVPTNIFV